MCANIRYEPLHLISVMNSFHIQFGTWDPYIFHSTIAPSIKFNC